MTGELVLVCDDGRENRDFIIEYILNPNNFQSLVARHGLECLELAREHKPDLILLDLQMPKMNGMQVLDALKEEELNIPVVLMTFHGSEEIAIEVYRKGVHDYLKKPFSVEEMLWAIERTLAEVRLRKDKEKLTERLIGANADMNQRIRELNTLYNVGKSVTSLVGLDELLPRIVQAAIEITESEAGSLYLLQGESLVCRAIKLPNEPQIRPANQVSNDSFAWRVIQLGQPVVLDPKAMEQHRQSNPQLPMAVLVTPLSMGDRVIGALGVSNHTKPKPFERQDGAMLSALSDYAAIAIENATNFAELARLKEHEVAKIRRSLRNYIPPNLLEQMLSGTPVEMGTVRTDVGILMALLRGYEPMIARQDPEQVTTIINQHLELAVDVLSRFGGTVEKYFGDGIIAYFNAPEPQDDFAVHAIEAALSLQQAVVENTTPGADSLRFSIGIHLGKALIGNIGAIRGLGYSAIGDVIPAVQRLQERAQPGQVLISEDLMSQVSEDIVQVTMLGQITLQDRQQRLNVFEVTGFS